MTSATDPLDLAKRLLFVNHAAWVRARQLAHETGNKELERLADTCEVLPMYWHQQRPDSFQCIYSSVKDLGLQDAFDNPFPS